MVSEKPDFLIIFFVYFPNSTEKTTEAVWMPPLKLRDIHTFETLPEQQHTAIKRALTLCREHKTVAIIVTKHNYNVTSFCGAIITDFSWIETEHVKIIRARFYPVFLVYTRLQKQLVRQLFHSFFQMENFNWYSNTRLFPNFISFEEVFQ